MVTGGLMRMICTHLTTNPSIFGNVVYFFFIRGTHLTSDLSILGNVVYFLFDMILTSISEINMIF